MQPPTAFCSQYARSSGASPAGTATEASTWLLIEVPGPWGSQALSESDLPGGVRSHLKAWLSADRRRRVQFVRRSIRAFDRPGRIRVFLASVQLPAHMHHVELEHYADLLTVDLEASAADMADPWERHERPVFLTCTNGRRDACCAKWGRAMADAMSAADPEAAWRTTHLGGHRFAPTQLVLPHGTQYAWLEPADAPLLIDAHRKNRLYRLHRYRGYVGFDRPVQAAELFLRQQLKLHKLDAVHLERVNPGGDTWLVVLRVDTDWYEVTVAKDDDGLIIPSCGDELEPSERWIVERHAVV